VLILAIGGDVIYFDLAERRVAEVAVVVVLRHGEVEEGLAFAWPYEN
jgi:hypothetical protein